jgi:hypothetical protein
MASTITAGNATNGLAFSADNTGALDIKTGSGAGATAISISSAQVVAFNGGANGLVALTAQASTSGTSIDFTGIPNWVKRITVMFNGVSTSGASPLAIQLGDSGGVENTGYVATGQNIATGAVTALSSTTHFPLAAAVSLGSLSYGAATISLVDATANAWVLTSNLTSGGTTLLFGCGGKSLTATLTQVRITTVGGSDTFDAGSINILYE